MQAVTLGSARTWTRVPLFNAARGHLDASQCNQIAFACILRGNVARSLLQTVGRLGIISSNQPFGLRPAVTRLTPGDRFVPGNRLPSSQPLRMAVLMMDVAFELLDGLLLLCNNRLHQVADRHDADDLAVLDHGQVADAAVGHEFHAILHRLVG